MDDGNQDWIDHCLDMSCDAYEAVLGERCEVVRFEDRFMSPETMNKLEQPGIRVDLTT